MRLNKDYRSRHRHADGHLGTFKAYTCNRYMSGGKVVCSAHYINYKVLVELLLIDIRYKAMLAQNSPKVLKAKILAQKNAASMEQTKALKATLSGLDKLEQRTQLMAQLEATQEDEQATDDWLSMIRDYAQLEELDCPTLLRLIKRIEVGEKYKLDVETHRDIKIYYNFVGYIEV